MAASVDATRLFLTAAENHRKCRVASGIVDSVSRLPSRPTIHLQAEELSRVVKKAAVAVFRLHSLARRRALFNDPAADINELAQIVKHQLEAVNVALEKILLACNQEPGADPRKGLVVPSPRLHWTLVVETLRQHALDVTRIFQDALSTRARNLQEHSQRRRMFDRSTFVPSILPDAALFAPLATAPAPAAAHAAMRTGPEGLRSRRAPLYPQQQGSTAYADDSGRGRAAPPLPAALPSPLRPLPLSPTPPVGRRGEGASLRGLAPASVFAGSGSHSNGASPRIPANAASTAYTYTAQQVAQYHTASARADEQHHVEATVVEIGHMFTRMASLVAEQEDVTNRLDADMDETLHNVEAGHTELLQFYESVSRHRSFILKLLAVMTVVVLVVAALRR